MTSVVVSYHMHSIPFHFFSKAETQIRGGKPGYKGIAAVQSVGESLGTRV